MSKDWPSSKQEKIRKELRYTLLSDGSSDEALLPILIWLLRENGIGFAIQSAWADLRRLIRPPANSIKILPVVINRSLTEGRAGSIYNNPFLFAWWRDLEFEAVGFIRYHDDFCCCEKVVLPMLLGLKLQQISEEQIFYVTLEDHTVLEVCDRSAPEFANYLKGLGANLERRNYVFIDEIQYLQDPTHFLKYIFDEMPALKLFVTGSSTLEIRRKFKDSLAGRKVVFELAPLDFSEFLSQRVGAGICSQKHQRFDAHRQCRRFQQSAQNAGIANRQSAQLCRAFSGFANVA